MDAVYNIFSYGTLNYQFVNLLFEIIFLYIWLCNYYYQFYWLGTGGFHKKADPVRCVTQSQREPIRIKQGRMLLKI